MRRKTARIVVLWLAAAFGAGCFRPVLSEGELSDPGIKARLESKLKADRGLDLRYVTVDVHMRVVTISGLVPSWENKVQIERMARNLRGVDQVVCNLIVQE